MEAELRKDIKAGLKGKTPHEILKAMGYPHPSEKNMHRLENVLTSKTLGLKDGGFDLKYSTPEFLVALSKVARLDEQEVRQRIGNINQDVSDDWQAFKPYIWVDTHFKRTTQPLFALAACESFRYVSFPKGFWQLSLEQQLAKAQTLVREHMAETDGTLKMWGDIQEYWFFYEPRKAYRLAPDGAVLGKHNGPVSNSASVTI
ncbi:hypothetical protein [Marinobacter persicus]|uniref:Uncharacterized protein n=1 Tax=Marinobacter persicus TaxID=930118 RepID=A0A2S6G2P4_9GAMM|nr:hypothetical protein [Marinobacter persicus]PPK50052.1 hypothetical protein BY455_13622 [Marinobacter persicus]PPK52238.1 hypothetical protein B0H24_103622 [Marinobacter persicus]PPK56629.1 hypothetical protein BY454_13622 [Marinobacter persicus]